MVISRGLIERQSLSRHSAIGFPPATESRGLLRELGRLHNKSEYFHLLFLKRLFDIIIFSTHYQNDILFYLLLY